jgi:shikimate kinase
VRKTTAGLRMLAPGQNTPLCITLIGMAGAGKSLTGKALAELLGWVHVDTDRILESYFGIGLQLLQESLGRDGFLLAEERLICELFLNRCIISTGGSVVYSDRAMKRLHSLGPVVLLEVELTTIQERLGDYSDRGLVIRSGQSIRELFEERRPLYLKHADHIVTAGNGSPLEIAETIHELIKERLAGEGEEE